MTHVITSAVPPGAADELAARLTKALRSDVAVVDWKDGPTPGGLLVLAPHELADDERRAALASVDYSWVHVTSAGVDFAGLADVGPGTLLTRSWRCYAAPLAEYAMHAILTHESVRTPVGFSTARRSGAPGRACTSSTCRVASSWTPTRSSSTATQAACTRRST
ncbi:hypothetical protein [Cellulomonas telluris]|uniref:hypothetical protein n=1 Tax=Cellulomonas telluris TaxID=2306636 RepID=UPI001FE3973B|nr:hypothetical protein [Cellulomonas telluris]